MTTRVSELRAELAAAVDRIDALLEEIEAGGGVAPAELIVRYRAHMAVAQDARRRLERARDAGRRRFLQLMAAS